MEKKFSRRDWMRLGLMATTGTALGSRELWGQTLACSTQTPIFNIDDAVNLACGVGLEAYPYSPILTRPFAQDLPLGLPNTRKAMAPGYRRPDGTIAPVGATDLWSVRQKNNDQAAGKSVPGGGVGYQDSIGDRPNGVGLPRAGTHQLYPGQPQYQARAKASPVAGYPDPITYHIRLQVNDHKITTSPLLPVGLKKNGVVAPISLPGTMSNNGAPLTKAGTDPVLGSGCNTYNAPASTIYGFNGAFPGPMINAEYGKPVMVRFENDLDYNARCLPRYDYGSPDWAFLTHLHNGHTAPESDGNPNHMTDNGGGYQPGQWCDNLYLGYAAGGDEAEKQSFLWFHDHRMHHTGANVYKGLVGLMPHYDPIADPGDERAGKRLPGVKRANGDGTFDVDYDIPMALYDCTLDDGVTPHFDNHQATADCGKIHPEWWGQKFFRHYPNTGFVGDIFTVNGVAYPVLHVKPRRYRFRFLGASIARCYELSFRTAPADTGLGTGQPGVGVFPGLQGQWNFATKSKQGGITRVPGTLLKGAGNAPFMLQIASEGGLLQQPIYRDSIQIWPAKRREVVVDFTGMAGQTLYLVNSMLQLDGKKPTFAGGKGFDPNYAVPLVKIVVDIPMGGEVDNSDPIPTLAGKTLRVLPQRLSNVGATPTFSLKNGNPLNPQGVGSGETKWLVNDMEFNPTVALHTATEDTPEIWTLDNLSGGWTHPFHMHQEEHQVLSRAGSTNPHPEDQFGKEDVVALDPGESVTFYRNFRTFTGKYVAHCHNLAHEDHNMMFGWNIKPKA